MPNPTETHSPNSSRDIGIRRTSAYLFFGVAGQNATEASVSEESYGERSEP
jgi:hypothetical protein